MNKLVAMLFAAFTAVLPGVGIGQTAEQDSPRKLCVDRCGDGTCQEIVCLGEGCPCAETPVSCAEDCAPKE